MGKNKEALMPRKGTQIPILNILNIDQSLEFALSWEAEGNTHLEVLLRSSQALEAVAVLARETGLVVAAGTILQVSQLKEAVDAGAHLAVSPGFTIELAEAAAGIGVPLIPGVHTPSEIQFARENGLRLLKFFPASMGGVQYLKEIAPVFPDVEFIPSGGVGPQTFQQFLELENVRAVGGRWMLPK